MIFGDLGGLKLPDICHTGEENPEKTSPKKLVPTGDRTRARFLTGAHATAWPTEKFIYNMWSKLDSFLRKRCFLFCFVHVVPRMSLEIMRKKITSVGLSCNGVILFSKIFYVFDVFT